MKKVAQDERARPVSSYNWNNFSQRQMSYQGGYSPCYSATRGLYTPPPYHSLDATMPNMYYDNYNYQHNPSSSHGNPSLYQYPWPYYK